MAEPATPTSGSPVPTAETDQQQVARLLIQKDLELADSNNQLVRQIQQFKTLQYISNSMHAGEETEVLNLAAHILVTELQFSGCLILLGPTAEKLGAQYSYKPLSPSDIGIHPLIRKVCTERTGMVVYNDKECEQDECSLAALLQLNSFAVRPMHMQGICYGVLICGLDDPYTRLKPADVEFFDILAQTIAAFCEHVASLEQQRVLEKLKSDFISFASHQLRTPITAIRLSLTTILDGVLGPVAEEQRGILAQAQEYAITMSQTISALLCTSQIESGSIIIEFADAQLKPILDDILNEQKIQGELRKQTLTLVCNDAIVLHTDKKLLKEMLTNLVNNAMKYSPNGGAVSIVVTEEERGICMHIKDSGIGIPKAMQEKVFSKFFRADNARKQRAEGTGIGLYLVASLAKILNSSISFVSEENAGTTFSLCFSKTSHGKENNSVG